MAHLERFVAKAGDSSADKALLSSTQNHLYKFASDGLRTLMVAQREISEADYNEWASTHAKAEQSLKDREELVSQSNELIEVNLELLGATAIEDKLQEEVPETIRFLLEAGIRVWVLTGDKQETAVNIGYSSHLLHEDMDLLFINAKTSDEAGELLRHHLERQSQVGPTEKNGKQALVIDGQSLQMVLDHYEAEFLQLAESCHSVWGTQGSPLTRSASRLSAAA